MTFIAFAGIGFGLLVAITFGYFLTVSFLPAQFRNRFALVFAPGLGLGLSSLIFFVFRRPVFTVEFALLVPISVIWIRRQSWLQLAKIFDLSWRPSVFALIFTSGLSLAATGLFLQVDRMPHGDWDGWAIWNTHARVFHRAGPIWRSVLPYTFHGDYPLLTPAVAARFWRYAGGEVPEAGAFLGILLSLSGVGILGLTLGELRDPQLGTLFSFVLLGTPNYLALASDQYADVPLSFFILSAIALILLYFEREPSDTGLLVLAGFTMGCAAWTKNEGLLFVLATPTALLATLVLRSSKVLRQLAPFTAGAMIPLAVLLFFKLTIATQNDLIENSNYGTLQGILNWERHVTILRYLAHTFWSFGAWAITPLIPLLALAALRGVDTRVLRSSGWLAGSLILAIMASGYYVVYLVTPLDLHYHLDSSLDRLMIHLWPSFLLLLGLATRSGARHDEIGIPCI